MDQEFKTQLEITAHLNKEGWKISSPTLSRHIKEGRLRPNKDGIFTLKAVEKYASDHLVRKDTLQQKEDQALYHQKISKEVRKTELQIEREEIRLKKERGELVERDQVDLMLASMVAVMKTEVKSEMQTRAAEIIEAVDGDMKKVGHFIRIFEDVFDQALGRMAASKEWHVTFLANKPEQEKNNRLKENHEETIH